MTSPSPPLVPPEASQPADSTKVPGVRGQLGEFEVFWRDHYQWLLEHDYQLRSRYHPDWTPSWEGNKKKRWYRCPDGLRPPHNSVLDAYRRSDGERLLLKRIDKSTFPYEAEIGQYLSTHVLASDPRNHCVPIYDVLQVDDDDNTLILVMPLLRRFDSPRFDTIGEAVEFFRQIFEGLQFMHQHNIAHRDATYSNIMMDARSLYVEPYHFCAPREKLDLSGPAKYLSRTQKPVKYYLTDFGLSRKYKSEERPPLEDVIIGGDRSVPEFSILDSCDPFPTDVYTIGNLIRENFTEGTPYTSAKQDFNFMKSLLDAMTQEDPSKRPTMDEVVERFEKIRCGLGSWKLRSRVIHVDDSYMLGFVRTFGHWKRRVGFIVNRLSPLPKPA